MTSFGKTNGFTLIETILGLAVLSIVIFTWIGFMSVNLNNKKRVIETGEIQAVINHVEHTLKEGSIETFPYTLNYRNYVISVNAVESPNPLKNIKLVQADLNKSGKKLFSYQTIYPVKN